MKRFLEKNAAWVIIAGMLLFCVGMGIATRLSFTNAIADPNLLKASYWYYNYTPKSLNDSVDGLKYGSGLIAVVRPKGEKGYLDRALLTDVEVVSVYQGDPALAGETILIYEPVDLRYTKLKNWIIGDDSSSYDYILSVYPNLSPEDTFLNASPQVDALDNHPPMAEGKEYLVFLTTKKYPPEHKLYQQTHEYNFVQSIYAILDLAATEDDFVPAPDFLSIGEAMEYPVLLKSQADLDVYLERRNAILEEILGGQP